MFIFATELSAVCDISEDRSFNTLQLVSMILIRLWVAAVSSFFILKQIHRAEVDYTEFRLGIRKLA